MRVVVAPVVVDGRICRIVSPVATLLEVEEWAGEWWEPSVMPLTLVSSAPLADAELLRARGLPVDDCTTSEPRPSQVDIEALMMTRDPEQSSEERFNDDVRRTVGTRRRKYPGNARFRREPRGGPGVEADRRQDSATEWHGPWRRASDTPPPAAPPSAAQDTTPGSA
jgi:hypothetical protein